MAASSSLSSSQSTGNPIIQKFLENIYSEQDITIALEKKGRDEVLVYKVPDQVEIYIDKFKACQIQVDTEHIENGSNWKGAVTQLAQAILTDPTITALWLNYKNPVEEGVMYHTTPIGFKVGAEGKSDQLPDKQTNQTRRWMWLSDKECTIPSGAVYNVGACALLLDEVARKALLVNANSPGPRGKSWELPGGDFDPIQDDKDPRNTAIRELLEESGILMEIEIKKPQYIGKYDWPKNQIAPAIKEIYAIFMDNISEQPLNPPEGEIRRAQWFTFDEILEADEELDGLKIGKDIKAAVRAAIDNVKCALVENEPFKRTWIAQKPVGEQSATQGQCVMV